MTPNAASRPRSGLEAFGPAFAVGIAASLLVVSSAPALRAKDLAPRAYVITPVGSNAVTMAYSYNYGSLLFDATVPITDATGEFSVASVACYRSLRLLGRSANVTLALPYGVGTFEGTVLGEARSIYRSGLFNSAFRSSVNLAGGPAISLPEMRQWAF